MTGGKNKTLSYDIENRLTQVNELGTITTFTYDGDGGRVKQTNQLTNYLFTGKELDNTGLYYFGERYYDLEIAHFTSADSLIPDIDNPQAINPYSYVLNNPINLVDPTGNLPESSRDHIDLGTIVVTPNWESIISNSSYQSVLYPGYASFVNNLVSSPKFQSFALDLIPGISTGKGVGELISGRDLRTGDPANRFFTAVGLATSIVPGGNGIAKGATTAVKSASKKAILFGENMDRVKAAAKILRAAYYKGLTLSGSDFSCA